MSNPDQPTSAQPVSALTAATAGDGTATGSSSRAGVPGPGADGGRGVRPDADDGRGLPPGTAGDGSRGEQGDPA